MDVIVPGYICGADIIYMKYGCHRARIHMWCSYYLYEIWMPSCQDTYVVLILFI